MSGGNALAVSMSLVAGVAGTVQIAVMGRLGDRIGVVPAFAFAAAVAAGLGALALLAARSSFTGYADAVDQPWWPTASSASTASPWAGRECSGSPSSRSAPR
jgi:uncharacterized membrane protein YdcZ (DUF606 family)